MMMLSRLRRFELIDRHEKRARLTDVAVALLEDDYPPVTRVLFQQPDGTECSLSWSDVESIDVAARWIKVKDLAHAEPTTPELPKGEVLLRRDILDALVLDLQNRRATRANDLCLEETGHQLRLHAADTSARAMLRRLTGGRYTQVRKSGLFDWKYVEFLRGDPQAVKNGAGYNLRITRLPPGEIARLTDPLPYLHAAELITLLPDPKAADTLEAMSPERQLQVFEELEEDQAIRLLELMAPDAAANLVGHLKPDTTRLYLNRLPKDRSERIVELLRYPEDTVGGIMTNDVVCIAVGLTITEARRVLRERLKEPGFVFLIYVVDDEETRLLRGLVSLRTIVTADDEAKIENLMDPYVTTLHPWEEANESAYRVINSHLAAMPVTGSEGQLVGIVTVDAAVALVAPQSWRSQAPRVFT
ncbi:MAG: magnesium transporter MgtE N-terminal domain-containing protein [Pyrinomonadaceae bacterium]